MKKTLFAFCAAVLLLVPGCGYRIGLTGHPQISSIAVAPVANETLFFNAAGMLRSHLCERITTDGTYKLERETDADCTIHARVLRLDFSQISWSSKDDDLFFPEFYRVKVTVEFSVILPGRVKPLIGPETITASAMFDHIVDLETARRNGVKQALWQAAKKIVDGVTERW